MAAAMAMQSAASYRAASAAAETAQMASVGSLAMGLCAGGLGAVTVAAVGAAGWFYLRWRLTERAARSLPRRRRTLPRNEHVEYGEPVFLTGGTEYPAGLDLTEWGW